MTGHTDDAGAWARGSAAMVAAAHATAAHERARAAEADGADDATLVALLLDAALRWSTAEAEARAAGLTHAAQDAADAGEQAAEGAAAIAAGVWQHGSAEQQARLRTLGLHNPADDGEAA